MTVAPLVSKRSRATGALWSARSSPGSSTLTTTCGNRPTRARFAPLIGAYIDEYWPARAGETFDVQFGDGQRGRSDWWQDSLHPESADVLATYTTGHLAGRAAILDHRLGQGRVVYLGTRLESTILASTLLNAVADAGVAPVIADAPAFVEATVRFSEQRRYLFLLNHSDVESATVPIPGQGWDLVGHTAVDGVVNLAPLQVAVIRLR